MVSLRHSKVAIGDDNPDRQVSVSHWNAEHTLTGTANTVLAFDSNGAATTTTVAGSLGYTPLNPANNLSDVSAVSTARTNLKLDSPVNVKWYSATGDGVTDDTTAIQNAINAVYATGGTLWFPPGTYKHTGLTFKNKVNYRGAGGDIAAAKGTILYYTGTGDGVVISNPINSTTSANISVEGITFKNATRNAGKGSFADTGSTFLSFRRCTFTGSDRGLILDQSELTDITECDFEIPATGTSGVWLVNGADRTVGASVQYTNRISVKSSQFNGPAAAYGIVDDGGTAHSFVDNNYNGCLNHIRAAAVTGLKISGGEFESAAGACIQFNNTTLLGTAAGSCVSVYIGDGATLVPSAGQNCIIAFSLANIVFNDVYFGNSTAVKFNGTTNTNAIYAVGCANGGGGATFDGRATNHWEVGHDGTDFKVRTNLAYSWGGTTIVNASGVLQAAGFPALTGDVTTPGASLAATIAANAVTYAKFQQVAASSLVGNPTGSLANAQGITLAADHAFSGTTLQLGAFTGDVTKSAGSLATTVTKINGVALSGLATGILKNTTGTGVPSIAVAGDFPTLNQNTTGSAATLTTPRTISITGKATAAGGTFDGSAALAINVTALTVDGAITPTSCASTGAVTSSSATAGIGYASGARGTITQNTSKATGVTSNTVVTDITLNGAALASATVVSFVFTNSAIAANDTLILNHVTTGTFGAYVLNAHGFAAGSCTIDVRNVSAGSLSEAIVIRAVLVKGG